MDSGRLHLDGSPWPMIGRDRELALLVDAYRDAERAPSALVIVGEAGIGKTRLVSEFLCRLPSTRALRGSCLQLDGEPVPFAAIEDAWQDLARMTPDAPAPTAFSERAGRVSRLRQFDHWLKRIEGLADDTGPAILVIEDLQWVDESTLSFLTFVVRAVPGRRVMVIITRRDDEPAVTTASADILNELLRAPRVQIIPVRRLKQDDVAELTTLVWPGTVTPAALERVWDRTQGNPYLLIELATAGGAVPAHVQDGLLARVRRLHGDAQSLVRFAAVAGLSVADDVLWRASSMDGDRYLVAVRASLDAGVLLSDSGGYVFRHSLTRDALVGQLLPLELRRLHASIASALELEGDKDDPATLAAIAVHWKAAGERHRAFPSAYAAARRLCALHAYGEAWQHFQMALELVDLVDIEPDPIDLFSEAAEAARRSGNFLAGVRLLRKALRGTDDQAGQARLHALLGRTLWEAGHSAESYAAYSAAADLVARASDFPMRPAVLASLARASAIMTSFTRAAEEARTAIDAARQAGLVVVEADALITLGVAVALLATGDGPALIREALVLLDPDEDLETICRAYANLVFVLEHQGRHDEACDIGIEGLRAVGRHGLELGDGAGLATNMAAIFFNRGRYDECETLLAELIGRGPVHGQRLHLHIELAGLEVARGNAEAARASLLSATELANAADEPWVVLSLALVEAELFLLEGQAEQARRTVDAVLRQVASTEDEEIRARLCRLGLEVEAACLTAQWVRTGTVGSYERLIGLEDRIPRHADTGGPPDTSAEWSTARMEAARARRQDSPDGWRQTAELWRRADRPRDLAYCLLREAERAAEQRLSRRAAEASTEARQLASQLGARPIVDGVDALRRRARLPQRRSPKAEREQRVPAGSGLTVREQQVLDLIGQGRTNRQIGETLFISERTAAVHVSSILRKLGVDNRLQAASLAMFLRESRSLLPTHQAV